MKGEIGVDYTVIHIKFWLSGDWDGPPFEAPVGRGTKEWRWSDGGEILAFDYVEAVWASVCQTKSELLF